MQKSKLASVAAFLGAAAGIAGDAMPKLPSIPQRKNVKVRNTSARSMRHLLNTRVLTSYHGEQRKVIEKNSDGKNVGTTISMPINLGRNAEKRALRRGKPRKAWGTLAPHREAK